jgi:hypothetical protein
MFRLSKKGVLLLAALMLNACTSSSQHAADPKGRLTDYVAQSFSVKSATDKEQLLSFLTGSVKTRLQGWSDDQFKDAFVDSKREFLRLSIREMKSISPTEMQITYELTYMDSGKNSDKSHKTQVTDKRLCQMTLENGKWMIADVKNIKELVEYQNEMSIP